MQLVLTEDQELLAKTAADFVAEKSPDLALVRALRDANDVDGFSRELWKEMAELGWVGIPVRRGCTAARASGWRSSWSCSRRWAATLAPEPFSRACSLGGRRRSSFCGQRGAAGDEWLPAAVAAGDALVTLAYAGARADMTCVCASMARQSASGGGLANHRRTQGPGARRRTRPTRSSWPHAPREPDDDGGWHHALLRPRRGARGSPESSGSTRLDRFGVAALLTLDRRRGGPSDARGAARCDCGGDLLERRDRRGTVALCAEMLGGMSEVLRPAPSRT